MCTPRRILLAVLGFICAAPCAIGGPLGVVGPMPNLAPMLCFCSTVMPNSCSIVSCGLPRAGSPPRPPDCTPPRETPRSPPPGPVFAQWPASSAEFRSFFSLRPNDGQSVLIACLRRDVPFMLPRAAPPTHRSVFCGPRCLLQDFDLHTAMLRSVTEVHR